MINLNKKRTADFNSLVLKKNKESIEDLNGRHGKLTFSIQCKDESGYEYYSQMIIESAGDFSSQSSIFVSFENSDGTEDYEMSLKPGDSSYEELFEIIDDFIPDDEGNEDNLDMFVNMVADLFIDNEEEL